jgi:hypothetical protein
MSNRKYLEIDSTYRNRKQYPNPSNFTVLIAQSGTRNALHAYDPVSLAAPQKTWVPDELRLTGGNVEISSLQPLNTKEKFTICFATGGAVKDPGYYNGYPIEMNTVPPGEIVKITSWNLLSSDPTNDCFTITVKPEFSSVPAGNVTFALNATNLAIGSIFIPDGFIADNYYVDCIMYNEDLNDYRPIISYDGSHKLAGLDMSAQYGGPVTGGSLVWNTGHTYSIRKVPPQFTGVTSGVSVPAGYNSTTTFFVPSETIIRVGDFIRFTSTNNKNKSCRVTGYTGIGQIAVPTSNPPILFIPPNLVTTDCILDIPPANLDTFEVLQFTRDNAVPFCYSGSLVSQQEMVCYQIELINLILPNKTLTSGGRVAFYPYVYVELQNVSGASAGTKRVIYSNNPNAKRMLFRAAIDDIPNPVVSPFVKIDGDGMVQTVKFKPNDNFKFGVYLPNGKPLETIFADNESPDSVDPLLQVSALFSIQRL